MKKIFLSLSLSLLCLLAISAAANDPSPISKEVQDAFKKEFPAAQLLNWNSVGEFQQATFLLDGHRAQAYFSEDARLLGIIRSLFFSQLPLAAMTAIDKRYSEADVMEVYEITNDEGTNYNITLESLGKKFKVKVDANGNITKSDKLKK